MTHQQPNTASRTFSTVTALATCSQAHQCITMSFLPPPKAATEHDKYDGTATEPHPAISVKSSAKPEASLNATFGGGIRAPSPDPSLLSIDDSNNIRLGRNPDYVPIEGRGSHASRSPAPCPKTWRGSIALFWTRNKGLAYVLFSQLFGTLMNVATRMLEIEGNNGMSECIGNRIYWT